MILTWHLKVLQIQELFKFGRKTSQAKSKSDNEGNIASGNILMAIKAGGSDRRKSIGTAGRATTLTPSNVALSDIPYCGESSLLDDTISNKATASPKAKKEKSIPAPVPPSTAQSSVRLQQPLNKEVCYIVLILSHFPHYFPLTNIFS